MDLVQGYPRSVYEKFAGVVMLARTIDKGRATAAGTNGEYHYNCPMDKSVFEFLGLEADAFLEKIKAHNDADLETYVRDTAVSKKTATEIEAFNADFVTHGPSAESQGYFNELRDKVAPGRHDITTWAQVLDADEGRPVPQQAAV